MKTSRFSITTALLSLSVAVAFADDQATNPGGPRFATQAAQPRLGEPAEFEVPPAPAPLPENALQGETPGNIVPPAPSDSPQTDSNSAPADGPVVNPGRQNEAIAGIVNAQEMINQGRYEEAVRQASRSIALDPVNAAEFKKIRADAYVKLGRFEEALADANPLEVTVTSPRAELKTKQTVLGVVAAGTKLTIDDVNGSWLKVAAAGDQKYDWAWIRQRDVMSEARPLAAQSPDVRSAPQKLEYNIPSYAPMPIDPGPRVYFYYGPGGPYYGRDYYDYWQNVPPQYWQFLP